MGRKDSDKTARNQYIELLRFIFCMVIFIHHSGHLTGTEITLFPSGGLAADAFFMLSGYYAIRHIYNVCGKGHAADAASHDEYGSMTGHSMRYSMRYTLKKLLKTLPYMATGTVIIYLLEIIQSGRSGSTITPVDIISHIRSMLIELTYLPLTGIMGPVNPLAYRNAPMWYLSAMLIALPVIMYVAVRYKDVFRNYIVWFVPMLLQSLMIMRFGGVLPWQDFIGPVSSGVIRGFSSMLMGGAIFYASKGLTAGIYKTGKSTTQRRVVLTIAELGLLALFICNVIRGVGGYEELFTLYIIAGMLTLALSGVTYTGNISWKPLGFLGRISLPIYCLHWGMYRWTAAFLGMLDYRLAIVIVYILCLTVAVVIMYIQRLWSKRVTVSRGIDHSA